MKPRPSTQRNQALTITEVLATVAAASLLALVALAQSDDSRARAQRINCVNNLKEVGLAFRIWGGDNNDQYPMQIPAKKGGAKESAEKGIVYPVFQVMSNELGSTPKILICPADTDRFAADSFTAGFDNSKVSYFVGVDAGDDRPAMLLSGDDNFAIDDAPVKSGLLLLATNAPVSWTAERHVNQGNIGLADGFVQTTGSSFLRQMLVQTGTATNRLALP